MEQLRQRLEAAEVRRRQQRRNRLQQPMNRCSARKSARPPARRNSRLQ
jgi:hypothetical protein